MTALARHARSAAKPNTEAAARHLGRCLRSGSRCPTARGGGACGLCHPPLNPYSADTPPLVVVPAAQAGVQDKRARLPTTGLATKHADHWAVAVRINRTHSTIAATFVTQNAYPREVLLETLLHFVEEDSATPSR
jgi:hypothetical protein